jgi:chromosome segregation ATPase
MQLECARRDAANPGIATGTLRKHIGDLLAHIEMLEWENKGIEEWRDVAKKALAKMKEQRERAERAEAKRDALQDETRDLTIELGRRQREAEGFAATLKEVNRIAQAWKQSLIATEAERDALTKKLAGLEQYRSRDQLVQRVLRAEAERDALRAENERLRGLLREAAPWLRPSEDSPPELDVLHARIDAALAGEKP